MAQGHGEDDGADEDLRAGQDARRAGLADAGASQKNRATLASARPASRNRAATAPSAIFTAITRRSTWRRISITRR